jgi:hypothetical protein
MNTQEARQITVRNIIDIMDDTVMELKKIRNGGIFSSALQLKITHVLQFLKTINSENYEEAMLDKALYIEKEPLLKLHMNFKTIIVNDQQIDDIMTLLHSKSINDEDAVKIQRTLIEMSFLLYPSNANNDIPK